MIQRKCRHVTSWLLLSLVYKPLPTASFIVETTHKNIFTRIHPQLHLNNAHLGRTTITRKRESFRDNLIRVKATNVIVDELFDRNSSPAQEEQVVHDENKELINNESVGIPSYTKLIIFISTTIIIWLSEPLLSLVDTTVVGKFASGLTTEGITNKGVSLATLQLAALGPATMVCDNAFYLVYFLAIAVTNQLASSSGKADSSSVQVETTSHSLAVASILGSLITFIIFAFGGVILKFIIGDGGAMVNGIDMTSSLVSSAWGYAKIRGLLAPLTVMGMVAQAVCLATLDTKTPALAVLAASIINVAGDILLVAKFKMGLAGAALATAAAGVGSSFILLTKTKKKVRKWKASAVNKSKLPAFISLPDAKSFVSLAKLAGPIFFVLVGKIICYSSMTLRASDFEMMSLATHNIMLRVFFFFCTFGDSFSMAAQSFLPKILYESSGGSNNINNNTDQEIKVEDELNLPTRSNKVKAKKLLRRILLLASGMAITNSLLTKTILQQGGRFFTNDATILSLLGSPGRVFFMAAAVFLHPFIMTLEGSILASRDLGFLVTAYGGTMATLLSLLQFATSTFTDVWRALFTFQVIRCTLFGWRVYNKTRV
jgi:Na+-driven multidrug efflux pump